MQITIKTSKGIFNAGQKWSGHISELEKRLADFFTSKRLDDIAGIIKKGILRDLDEERKPSGGSLRALKQSTIKYKKGGKKLYETGRLRSQINYRAEGNKRIITIIGDRGQVAGYLQFGTKKMEAFEWFGVSEQTKKDIKTYIENQAKQVFIKAA